MMEVILPEAQIQCILQEAETDLNPYLEAGGRVVFESMAHIVTGTRSS